MPSSSLIKAHRAWRTLGIKWLLVGHAVFLPDVDRLDPLILPHAPREIMGGRQDLQDLEKWLQKVITFWEGETATLDAFDACSYGVS